MGNTVSKLVLGRVFLFLTGFSLGFKDLMQMAVEGPVGLWLPQARSCSHTTVGWIETNDNVGSDSRKETSALKLVEREDLSELVLGAGQPLS